MPTVRFDVEGDKELIKALVRAEKSTHSPEVLEVLIQAAEAIRRDAAGRIRDKTGTLRKSLFVYSKQPERGPLLSVLAGVSPKMAPHRHLVEYGHAGPHPAPPHPFWRPALDAQWPRWRPLIIRKALEVIERA